mmetsp:Transcript_19297/g.60643  ORF Transcript_19297/g.60643 Transcript_19297/m.60643 type:complete len:192 (+) Transcript_19297:84-659(+)|eukprot:CAMPEP_0204530580 /NCGR_PEP_ID=MMETSP0661-20131031/10700_1 /ASSEMBLY_ACC=CAM_ASM_000606 /TAXON_ID=109239 /ORGANISM="Alexandrium margalefi, Strain AMGDE01CS-322" /LENGTH=191 /DNA_ID=CAMNT_0051536679 /DNA_START=71 /DNA_END=646 /DNA_ORIENTATION=+
MSAAAGTAAAAPAGASAASSSGGDAEPLSFPAFRSEEWIRAEFDRLRAPAQILEGADLSPAYMTAFPTVNLYPGKVAQVREQIRTALFRQALFKVQNIEVTYLDECREPRVLRTIAQRAGSSLLGRAIDSRNPTDVELLREELWAVDRCGQNAEYNVRYYKEGGDGYSAAVLPEGLRDRWRALRYYYFSGE